MPKKVCNLFEMLNSKLKLVCNLLTVNSPWIYCWKISVIFINLKLIYKWNHAQCWLSSFAGCFVAWQLSWKIFIALICQILSGFAIFYCPMLFFACVTKLFVIPLACSQLLTSSAGHVVAVGGSWGGAGLGHMGAHTFSALVTQWIMIGQ